MAADENNETSESPFTRPGFIVSAVVVALVLVLGAILGTVGIVNATRDEPTVAPATTTSEEESEQPSEPAVGASICGLEGEVLEGTVDEAPAAEWEFQGTIGYPTSKEFGPGKTDATGVRSCFQHSPEGALFMAANAAAQGSDPATAEEWLRYALSDGAGRDALLDEGGEATGSEGTRVQITGYKVLNYDGDTAQVDLLATATSQGQSADISSVYYLAWEDGDWKLDTNTATPLDVGTAVDTSSYTPWEQ